MNIADKIIRRRDDLKTQRSGFEAEWRENAALAVPQNPDILLYTNWQGSGTRILTPNSPDRVAKIYDSTAVWALRRLGAGIESLTMPQSEKWHGLEVDNFFAPKESQEEKEYFQKVTDYLFRSRYHAKSKFTAANQHALRQLLAFGTGAFRIRENNKPDSEQRPFLYMGKMLGRCYFDVNSDDEYDTTYECCHFTARQIMQMFPNGNIPAKIKEAAYDPEKMDNVFELIHAIQPREETGSMRSGQNTRSSKFASYIVDVETRTLIEDSGYFEYPDVVYSWDREPHIPYGHSPLMLVKADVKSLNVMAKTALRAGQQLIAPPMGVPMEGMFNRLNLNSRAVNRGAVNEQGQRLVQPLVDGINPDFGQQMMEQSRQTIRTGLFMDLFQILIDNPNQTATEALIRADEKGQLLGPTGSNVQAGHAALVDRELGVLARKGAFDEDSALSVPENLQGQEFGPKFTSPLDRARRSAEVLGIQRTFEMAGMISGGNPEHPVWHRLDFDEAMKITAEIHGAPLSILKTDKEVQGQQQQQQQMMQLQQGMQIAQQGADIAGTAIPAAGQGAEILNMIAQQAPGTAQPDAFLDQVA